MVNIRKSPHLHRHSCRDITRYPYCIAMLLLLVLFNKIRVHPYDTVFCSFLVSSLGPLMLLDLTRDLTRLPSRTTSSRWQVDKEAIGLSRVQQFSHLCVARPYQISVKSIFKHIHTTSINTIIWQFVPFIYHPL